MTALDFSSLIGHEPIKTYLTRMIQHRAIAHALLFAGPQGVGKEQFARAFAAQLLCGGDKPDLYYQKLLHGNHPDYHFYRPEGKLGLHSMQSLRQLSEEVHFPPYESDWKVFVIDEADRMLSYSANALLKTFEEPPPRTVIILLSHQPQALIPTILSRCRTLHFQLLPTADIKCYIQNRYQLADQQAETFAFLAHGSLGRAVHLVNKGGDPHRIKILDLLAGGSFRSYKALSDAAQELAQNIESLRKEHEETAKSEIYKVPLEHLSAYQQQQLEKELEGIVAMNLLQEARSLFQIILSWYRDLHLMAVRGPQSLLMNPDYQSQLQQALQRGNILKLDEVQQAINETDLALQRSTSLTICLENLLLKLQLI